MEMQPEIPVIVEHVFAQRYFDHKEDTVAVADLKKLEAKTKELDKALTFYAIFPIMPIVTRWFSRQSGSTS